MKRKFFIFFMCCCCFGFVHAQRSLINGALNSAGRSVANGIANGITNAATKKAESIAEKQMEVFLTKKLSTYEKYLTEESMKYQAAMGAWQDSLIAMSNVPFEEEYVFNTVINTEITTTDVNGEKESMPSTYYLTSTGEYYGYGIDGMITVIDYKNHVMVCFSTSDTSNVYFAYKYEATPSTASDEGIQKIAGSKTICGYSCSGYKVTQPYYTGTCWASSSADFSGKYTNMYMPKTSYGFPLYMEGTITNNAGEKATYVSEAKSVKNNETFKIRKVDYKNMFE